MTITIIARVGSKIYITVAVVCGIGVDIVAVGEATVAVLLL